MREKLIELLKLLAKGCVKEVSCRNCEYQSVGAGCSIYAAADHLIANGWTEQRWIPVTERLPEYGEIVLAFGKRHATSGQFRGTSPTKPHWWHWKGNTYKEVSHWMPLPEAPKGE